MIPLELVKKLREETGVSISECKKALEQTAGDFEKARELLRKLGKEMAGKKSERIAGSGIIESYVHPNKKIGVMLELRCETDFVARSEDFQNLAHELCLQIAAISSEEIPLSNQPWIKDEAKTAGDLINEAVAKLGENIFVKRFSRFEI